MTSFRRALSANIHLSAEERIMIRRLLPHPLHVFSLSALFYLSIFTIITLTWFKIKYFEKIKRNICEHLCTFYPICHFASLISECREKIT